MPYLLGQVEEGRDGSGLSSTDVLPSLPDTEEDDFLGAWGVRGDGTGPQVRSTGARRLGDGGTWRRTKIPCPAPSFRPRGGRVSYVPEPSESRLGLTGVGDGVTQSSEVGGTRTKGQVFYLYQCPERWP